MVAVVVGAIGLLALLWPHLDIFTSRTELVNLIERTQPYGALVYIAAQITQVVIAPIPATVVTLAGGFIFDTFWGTILSMVGTTIGFLIVFLISKKFGRKVLRFVVPPEKMKKYDRIASSKGALAFIVFGFVFPFLPDPVVGYMAGLTPMRIGPLLLLSVVTRTPGVLITSFIGSSVGNENYVTAIVVGIVLVAILVAAFFYRGHIYEAINRLQQWMVRKP